MLAAGLRSGGVPLATTASAACRSRTSVSPFDFDGKLVGYEPAEAESKIKGGNSNWRGPIWFPTCFLLIESLRKLAKAFGNDVRVPLPQCREGSRSLPEMARLIAERMIGLFTRDAIGPTRRFRRQPHVPGRPPLARPSALLRIFPRRHGRRTGGLAPDGLDGPGGLFDRRVEAIRTSGDSRK